MGVSSFDPDEVDWSEINPIPNADIEDPAYEAEMTRVANLADPMTHRCSPYEIDYSRANAGRLACDGCGATWTLSSLGWKRHPRPFNPNNRRFK